MNLPTVGTDWITLAAIGAVVVALAWRFGPTLARRFMSAGPVTATPAPMYAPAPAPTFAPTPETLTLALADAIDQAGRASAASQYVEDLVQARAVLHAASLPGVKAKAKATRSTAATATTKPKPRK
jgi:hypothetical protein